MTIPKPNGAGPTEEDLIERLASIEHDRWSDWHKHCVKNWNVAMVSRWNEQANTPYSDLSESEKESDRKEVKRYFPLIQEYVAAERAEAEKRIAAYRKVVGGLLHQMKIINGDNEKCVLPEYCLNHLLINEAERLMKEETK